MAIKYNFYTEAKCGFLEDVEMGGLPSSCSLHMTFCHMNHVSRREKLSHNDINMLLRTSVNVF